MQKKKKNNKTNAFITRLKGNTTNTVNVTLNWLIWSRPHGPGQSSWEANDSLRVPQLETNKCPTSMRASQFPVSCDQSEMIFIKSEQKRHPVQQVRATWPAYDWTNDVSRKRGVGSRFGYLTADTLRFFVLVEVSSQMFTPLCICLCGLIQKCRRIGFKLGSRFDFDRPHCESVGNLVLFRLKKNNNQKNKSVCLKLFRFKSNFKLPSY